MSFDRAMAFVLRWEGGLSEDPRDPGGLTKYGISQRAYPNEDIRALTVERATELYRRDYWTPSKCSEMPWPVALGVFDMAVNAGVRTGARCLQRALGVADDGILGPLSLMALAEADVTRTTRDLAVHRLRHYAALEGWIRYGVGWSKRTVAAVIEGLAADTSPETPPPGLP